MFGYKKPSITIRIAWGKFLGFLLGLTGILIIPKYVPDAGMTFTIGVLLWYTTLGAIIGLAGIYIRQPVINIGLPWWFRGTLFGSWFNMLLVLFAYDRLEQIMVSYFGETSMFTSPWWFVLEGAIVGFVMDGLLTAIGGEGPQAVDP